MACDRPDVDEPRGECRPSTRHRARIHDHDLEVRALADGGLALITQGRIREGFDRLDSAMAAIAAGEVDDFGLAGQSLLLDAEWMRPRAGDVNRVDEWVRVWYARR